MAILDWIVENGRTPGATILAEAMVKATRESTFRSWSRDASRRFRALILERLEQGRDAGEIDPDLDLQATAMLLAAALDGLLFHHLVDPKLDVTQVAEPIGAMLRPDRPRPRHADAPEAAKGKFARTLTNRGHAKHRRCGNQMPTTTTDARATAAIETHRLTKRYGTARGIEEVDLRVEPGEVFGFLGPNGAGKSTTIRTLLDFQRPTSGSASIFGLDSRRDSVAIRNGWATCPAISNSSTA